jgi:hypothetical protein
MTKEQVMPYLAYAVDDALSERNIADMPANARFVGWQCGFEPLFVAVWSYLDVRLDDDEAEEIAADFLNEKNWFHDIKPADYII